MWKIFCPVLQIIGLLFFFYNKKFYILASVLYFCMMCMLPEKSPMFHVLSSFRVSDLDQTLAIWHHASWRGYRKRGSRHWLGGERRTLSQVSTGFNLDPWPERGSWLSSAVQTTLFSLKPYACSIYPLCLGPPLPSLVYVSFSAQLVHKMENLLLIICCHCYPFHCRAWNATVSKMQLMFGTLTV